ncbi:MAG: hypothetical protein AABW67_04910 [Nanoarchaeota archaeon]
METDKIISDEKNSNLTSLVAGIIISAAAVLPLAGCDMYTSYSTYETYPQQPRRIYIVPQPPIYYSPPRIYHPPQRPFNNGPYGNHPQQRHPQGPRGSPHGHR